MWACCVRAPTSAACFAAVSSQAQHVCSGVYHSKLVSNVHVSVCVSICFVDQGLSPRRLPGNICEISVFFQCTLMHALNVTSIAWEVSAHQARTRPLNITGRGAPHSCAAHNPISTAMCLLPVSRCLAENMASADFGRSCKDQIMKKLRRRESNWRLDPPLRAACREDVGRWARGA